MKIKIKASVNNPTDLENLTKEVVRIKRKYNLSCELLVENKNTKEQEQPKPRTMNEKYYDVIHRGEFEHGSLSGQEREIALRILEALEGTLAVRAKSILKFCYKAMQYTPFRTL